MANGKVEKIIEFQAGKAISQLDQVINRLNKTNQVLAKLEKQANAISFEKFIPSINSFANSFAKLKIDPQNLTNIQVMAQALNRFRMTTTELNKKGVDVTFAKVTKAVYSFSNSISRMNLLNETISKIGSLGLAINRLVNSSMKLQNMKVSFTSLTQAIYAFVGSILRIKDLETVIQRLERLGSAISVLSNLTKRFSFTRFFGQFSKLNAKLEKLEAELGDVKKESEEALTPLKNTIEKIIPALQRMATSAGDISTQFRTIRRLLSLSWLRSIFNMFKRIGETVYELVKAYSSYIENINLATVAYYGLEEAAKSLYPFVEKISSAFGLNESEVIRSVGLFKQMANAMGLAQEQGDLLATSLTKMAYDLSSLYNITFDRALSALQSSLVGQTKPIRGATGADITENTLRITLQELNIGKEIRELSYVEKRLIMVISLTKQLANAQGDLARTIESPANQLKILSQQLERLKIALGNLLTIFVSQLLPYINGFIMALVEVINYIAEFLKQLFGIQEQEYDYNGLTGTSDAVDEIIEGMEEANEKAEELKKNLLGIDELNILEPQETASTDNLIDPTIMAAFEAALKDWENRMDSVNMKAYQVRDALLSWFGLEYDEEGNPIAVMGGRLDELTEKIKNAKVWIDNLLGVGEGEEQEELPLLTKFANLKDKIVKIWEAVDGIVLALLELKFPLLTSIIKLIEGITEIMDRGADLENILDIIEGIGWALIAIGGTLNLPPFLGLGLVITGITKLLDDINAMLEDGKIELDEIAVVLLDLGMIIAGLALLGKLKTVYGWLKALGSEIVFVGKMIVMAIGGDSLAQAALLSLLKILMKVFGFISIIVGTFEIFKNIKGWIDGTIPPLQALFGILKGIALVVMGIMALIGNWAGVAIAGTALVAAGIAESVVKNNSKDGETTDEKKTEMEIEVTNEISSMDKAISSTVDKLSVKTYANGGYPSRGLFVMNDGNSAEMFGSINGKAAVVNNQEIASALAQAMTPLLGSVVNAVENVAASDRPIILNVDSRQMARANQKGSQKLGYNQIGGEFANV